MHIYDEHVYFFINHTLKDSYPLCNASWWSVWENVHFDGWTWTISRQEKENAPQETHITKGKAHQEHTHLLSTISHAHPWDAGSPVNAITKEKCQRRIHHQCLCHNLDNASMQKTKMKIKELRNRNSRGNHVLYFMFLSNGTQHPWASS